MKCDFCVETNSLIGNNVCVIEVEIMRHSLFLKYSQS